MANYIVTTLIDENDAETGVGTPLGAGISLREALALANGNPGGDSITFDQSLVGGSTPGGNDGHLRLTQGQLLISSDVIIDGDLNNDGTPDIAVDGQNQSRPFFVNSGNVTLEGLDLENGLARGGDG